MVNTPSVKYRSGYPESGQSSAEGFDCSGFVVFVLQSAGLVVPDYIGQDGLRRPTRHANELWDTYGIAVHEDMCQPGDLVFFSRAGRLPTHVGIVRDEVSYIHAPGRDNTSVEVKALVDEPIVIKDRTGVAYSKNPIGFKSPSQAVGQPTYRYHQMAI